MSNPRRDGRSGARVGDGADKGSFLATLKAFRFKGRRAAQKILTFSETMAELQRLGLASKP